MKLSISNIAWNFEHDEEIFKYLVREGYDGIEIAPTRLVATNPYGNIESSREIASNLYEKYGLEISSMQSIWFGRIESIFGTEKERNILIDYTRKAIEYAKAINCKNLVFGSPKNRKIDDASKYDIAVKFFHEIGECAQSSGVVIALEPNPVIYNTNFINYTSEALKFIKEVESSGLKVNLDLGTVLWNNEDLNDILNEINLINHIHISEPYLEQIKKREIHKHLRNILQEKNYTKYVSIEMKNLDNVYIVKETIKYVKEVMR